MTAKKIFILDTSLRDGAQSAQINYSTADKIRILQILDALGLPFAEAGAPGMSANDAALFTELSASREQFRQLRIVAFGATCRPGLTSQDDEQLQATVRYALDTVAFFGKADLRQINDVLAVDGEENLRMIRETVLYAVRHGKNVIFEAEHFFDGFLYDAQYAISVLTEAVRAGAERVTLCDTNGGMLPDQIATAVKAVHRAVSVPIGIHCHNDAGLAVANSLTAVKHGATDVHGTVCGIGERCGNANLCTLIPDLQLKMSYDVLTERQLEQLTYSARKIADISNLHFDERAPYVGKYAFAHKAGTHIDAELKNPAAFQHISPASVGNHAVFLLSNQSGRAAAAEKLQAFGVACDKNSAVVTAFLERIKENESKGYQYENADGSMALLILDTLGKRKRFFELLDFKIVLGDPTKNDTPTSALLKISVDGTAALVADEGIGPVNAMDKALRKALDAFYPALREMRLADYKVRVINSTDTTEASVMVSIDSTDTVSSWRTIGVSTDVIAASWIALCDSIEYKLSSQEKLF